MILNIKLHNARSFVIIRQEGNADPNLSDSLSKGVTFEHGYDEPKMPCQKYRRTSKDLQFF